MTIRPETEQDRAQIRHVLVAAFETEAEAGLVDALREKGVSSISLVAEKHAGVVGHILFTPARLIGEHGSERIAALAPMAVLPEYQHQGIGKQLVRAGLEACEEAGYPLVVVLGYPEYYSKFSFDTASKYNIRCPFEAPDDAFMVRALGAADLGRYSGVVEYHGLFGGLEGGAFEWPMDQ